MKIEKVKNPILIDKIGQMIAIICAVHCFLFPFLIPVLAFLPFTSSLFETALMSFAVFIALISLIHAIKHKRHPAIIFLFITGFMLFAAHILLSSNHNHGIDLFVIGASSALGIAHILSKKCNHNCSN